MHRHSFALFLATRDAYQAQLSAQKVLTFCERVLSLNKLHNSSNRFSEMTQRFLIREANQEKIVIRALVL